MHVALSHSGERVGMSYREDLSRLATLYRHDLEADLAAARQLLVKSRARCHENERRVEMFEALLALGSSGSKSGTEADAGKLTLHAAMRKVIEESPVKMMRASDIAAEIERRGLYRMRDGRPVEAQQIHARVGHYPKDFGREGTFIKLL
jgi:hypothetical protein